MEMLEVKKILQIIVNYKSISNNCFHSNLVTVKYIAVFHINQ